MNHTKLTIRHETRYAYAGPVGYTIQQLRLIPRSEPHQRIIEWHVKAPGKRHTFDDAFGNSSEILTITAPHKTVQIVAHGVIEITPPDRGRIVEKAHLSPLCFTVPTRLTEPGDAIHDFAARHITSSATTHALLDLAAAIQDTVIYQSGATTVETTAEHALKLGAGVCQDHAHLFLACCHTVGLPARYVSGYFDSGDIAHGASHAWVDVWVEEADFSGWISIDATHACLQDAGYCRLAIGRDYESAAPVRGVRRGGGEESLSVNVTLNKT